MKTYNILIGLFLFFGLQTGWPQGLSNHLDTIYTNEQKNVALFFPSPIQQGITGSDNFVFTYNREKEQHFGLLQAKPDKESNLLIISADGSIFSYILKYRKQLKKLNYFFKKSDRIGKVLSMDPQATVKAKQEQKLAGKTYYYTQFSSYLRDSKQRFGRIRKRKHNIVLRIKNIVFDKDELYFVIQIKNKSTLDYDLNFLSLFLETRKGGKKKSSQRLYKKPVFTYKIPDRIAGRTSATMVYVFPKFSIGKDHRALLRLSEKDGERDVKLKIAKRFINNPN